MTKPHLYIASPQYANELQEFSAMFVQEIDRMDDKSPCLLRTNCNVERGPARFSPSQVSPDT